MKKTLLAISLALGLVLSPTTTKPEPQTLCELTQNIALTTLATGAVAVAYLDTYIFCMNTCLGLEYPHTITKESFLFTVKHGLRAVALVLLAGEAVQQMN